MQQYFGISKNKDTILLNKSDLNHIKNVMRMHENDSIIVVFDNKSYKCRLNKDLLSADIIEVFKESEKNSDIKIYVPLLNEEKMSFILQHGTELGVAEFEVVMYEHCKYRLNKKDFEKKLTRWNKILKEASEQSYRIKKPILENIVEVKDIKASKSVNLLCSLDKSNVKLISSILTHDNCNDTISLVFGPEGGLSNKEEEFLTNIGFTKVSLGNDVLRTETVPLMVASIIKYLRNSD
jgi:16S rRNA (uracil1498-N3)-methyltransferase